MVKTLFLTDLDNSLIFSKRRIADKSNQYVSVTHEKTYMDWQSYILLMSLCSEPSVAIIPITSRDTESYRSLSFYSMFPMAALCSGSLLYCKNPSSYAKVYNGEFPIDLILEYYLDFRKQGLNCELHDNRYIRIRNANKEDFNSDDYISMQDKTDVYILMRPYDKGYAARFFRSCYNDDVTIIAYGDSEFDIPMLEVADVAFVPASSPMSSAGKYNVVESPSEVLQLLL